MPGVLFNPLTRLLLRFILVAVVAVAHMRAIFVLYPSQNPTFMRLIAPTLIAFVLYLIVVLRKHMIFSVVFAVILSAASLAGGLFAAINTYGN